MAFQFIFWPPSLPQKALLDGYTAQVASNIMRTEMDSGNARQRSRGDIITETLTFNFVMTETQLAVFRDFCSSTGGRSFWIPFPNPKDPRFADGKPRYTRFKSGQDAISEAAAEGGGEYVVPVTLEFWAKVPPYDGNMGA